MRWYMNLKMQAKLMLAFVVVAGIMIGVGAMGLRGIARGNASLDRLAHNELSGVSNAQDLRSVVLDVGRLYRQVLLDQGGGNTPENITKVEHNLAVIAADLEALHKLQLDAEERACLDKIEGTLPDWRQRLTATLDNARAGNMDAARAAAAGNGANAVALVTNLAGLTASFNRAAAASTARADREDAATRNTMIFVLLLGTALSLALGFAIARIVSRPLGQAVRVLERVSEGDFTQRLELDTADELGQLARALDSAVEGIRTSLLEVRASAEAVSTAARELSSSSGAISEGAQEQASSLEETAASLEQITSTVQQNADNSQLASQVAQGARDVAEKGGNVVESAVGAMGEISASSRRIAEIITTIDEIAFQTNLLALNAAVEAARAGEQGRGFAVVAGEVRNLAQRSAEAAKEIKGLIQDSVAKVGSGTELVNRSGESLREIVTAIKRVTDIVTEIAAASREQATGIGQVGLAVGQMDQVTQSNAAQTEELASTADSLSSQAVQLQGMVARYRLGVEAAPAAGTAARSVPARAPARAAKPAARPVLRRIEGRAAAPAPVRARTGTDDGFEEF
jgi:methyl-accepting chemotaxis protein